jgi:hypothetical protein
MLVLGLALWAASAQMDRFFPKCDKDCMETPLYVAINKGSVDIVTLLLKAGADVNGGAVMELCRPLLHARRGCGVHGQPPW